MSIEQRVKYGAQRTCQSEWFRTAARVGFLAKGVIYAIIGVFALKLAIGDGGALLGGVDATRTVKMQPFGQLLLALLAIGLACHSAWGFVRAAVDPEGGRNDVLSVLKRLGAAVSGVIHAALAVAAFQLLLRGYTGKPTWVHTVLGWNGGRWLLIAIGLITIGVGVYQLYQAYTAQFRAELDVGRMSGKERTWAVRVGRFGLAARGVVLPIVGWFFIQAGQQANAARVDGTDGAMREIAGQVLGPILLALVAAGFVAYAAYMAVSAKYRRIFA